jgi:hypothetical protein
MQVNLILKQFHLVVLFIFFSNLSYSQLDDKPWFLRTGLNYSTIKDNRFESNQTNGQLGYSISGGYLVPLGNRVNIEFSIGHEWLGTEYLSKIILTDINGTPTGVLVDESGTLTISQFIAPIYMEYVLNPETNKLALRLGLRAALMHSHKIDSEFEQLFSSGMPENNFFQYKPFNLSPSLGFRLRIKSVSLLLHQDIGIIDIYDYQNRNYSSWVTKVFSTHISASYHW